MITLVKRITGTNRRHSVGLIAIGVSMLVCSQLAEQWITESVSRELAQIFVIAAGLAAIAALFRHGSNSNNGPKGGT